MAYVPHYLASFGGRLGVPSSDQSHIDIWQCNVRLVGLLYGAHYNGNGNWAQPTTEIDPEAMLAYSFPKLQTWFQTNVGAAPNQVGLMSMATLEYLKINRIGANGKYADATTHQHTYPANVGGLLATTVPWTNTVAISWHTDKARGAGSQGRVFPPVFVPSVNQPVISATLQGNYVTLGKNLLACFSNQDAAATTPMTPVIATRGSKASGYTDGKCYEIQTVRVGNIIDSQRRRRNAFPESYASSPFTG